MSRTSGSAFRGALVGSTLTALLFIAVLEISEQPDLPAVLLWRGQEIVVDATAAGAAGDADAVYADPVNDDEAGRSPRAKKGKTLKAPSAKKKAKKKAARGSGAAKRPTSDAETGALLMVDADLITRRTFYDAVWETAAKLPPLTAAAAADAQIAAGGHELVFIGGQHFSGTSLVEALLSSQPNATGLRPDLLSSKDLHKAESSCMRVAVGGVCSAPENEGVFLTKALPTLPTPLQQRCAELPQLGNFGLCAAKHWTEAFRDVAAHQDLGS